MEDEAAEVSFITARKNPKVKATADIRDPEQTNDKQASVSRLKRCFNAAFTVTQHLAFN